MLQGSRKDRDPAGGDLYRTYKAGEDALSGFDEAEDRYPGRALPVQSPHGYRGACVCKHLQCTGPEPIQFADQEEGGYSVETLLYGAQSVEDTPIWRVVDHMRAHADNNTAIKQQNSQAI